MPDIKAILLILIYSIAISMPKRECACLRMKIFLPHSIMFIIETMVSASEHLFHAGALSAQKRVMIYPVYYLT
jgi:hypothetical protein